MITYSDFQLGILDEQYLDKLSKTYGIDRTDLPLDLLSTDIRDVNSADICNCIMYELLTQIVYQEVEDAEDREKLVDSIYCNCFDSGFDINEDKLKTEQAKEFLSNF